MVLLEGDGGSFVFHGLSDPFVAMSVHNWTRQLMPDFFGAVVDRTRRASTISPCINECVLFVGDATCSSRDDHNYIGPYPSFCPIVYESVKGDGKPHCATQDLVDAAVDGTHRLPSLCILRWKYALVPWHRDNDSAGPLQLKWRLTCIAKPIHLRDAQTIRQTRNWICTLVPRASLSQRHSLWWGSGVFLGPRTMKFAPTRAPTTRLRERVPSTRLWASTPRQRFSLV